MGPSFFTAKETVGKTKGKPTEWEKIFANGKTDTGLISKIYKQLIQLSIKKTNPTKEMGRRPELDIFLKKIYRWLTGTWKDDQHY